MVQVTNFDKTNQKFIRINFRLYHFTSVYYWYCNAIDYCCRVCLGWDESVDEVFVHTVLCFIVELACSLSAMSSALLLAISYVSFQRKCLRPIYLLHLSYIFRYWSSSPIACLYEKSYTSCIYVIYLSSNHIIEDISHICLFLPICIANTSPKSILWAEHQELTWELLRFMICDNVALLVYNALSWVVTLLLILRKVEKFGKHLSILYLF